MNLFKGICRPNAVPQQVLPVSAKKYQAQDEAVLSQDISIASEHSRLKSKPTVELEVSESSRGKRLEEEIFLFTLDLRIVDTPLQDFEGSVLRHESIGPLLYESDHTAEKAKTDLVTVLRQTIQHARSGSTTASNSSNIPSLAIRDLSNLLKNYQEYPPGAFPASPYNNNCFTSLRHALIIADIMITATYNCMSVSTSSLKPLADISLVGELIQNAINLCGFAVGEAANGLALPLGQISFKASQLLRACIQRLCLFLRSEADTLPMAKPLGDVVALVPIIAATIHSSRQICGEETLAVYLSTFMFWAACEHLLRILTSCRLNESLQTMARLWTNRVLTTYSSCIPQAPQLLFEVKRLESMDISLYGHSDDAALTQMIVSILEEYSPRGSSSKLLGALSSSPGSNLMDSSSYERKNQGRFCFSLHSRFLLVGMLQMMHLPFFQSSTPAAAATLYSFQPRYVITRFSLTSSSCSQLDGVARLVFPDREKWLCSLFEVLTYLLRDPTSATFVLAQLVAHLLVKISFSLDHDPSVDWVYVSFARLLVKFNRTLRMGHFFAATGPLSLHSMSSQSVEVVATGLHTPRRPSVTNDPPGFDLAMDTPFKGLQSLSTDQATPTPVTPTFAMGEAVQALFTLENGTTRWFPAKITAVHEEVDKVLYDLVYDDGDRAFRQAQSDIKPRRLPPSTSTNPHSHNAVPVTAPPSSSSSSSTLSISVPPPLHSMLGPAPALSPLLSPALSTPHTGPSAMLSPQGSSGGSELHRLVSLQQIPQVDADDDADDDDEESQDSLEDHVYEIPSIFDGYHRAGGPTKPPREGKLRVFLGCLCNVNVTCGFV